MLTLLPAMPSNNTIEKSFTTEHAMLFFKELEEVAAGYFDIHAKYAMLRDVFRRVVNQALSQTNINFIGLFAKVDYLMKQLAVPTSKVQLIHDTRRMLNDIHTTSGDALAAAFPYDGQAAASLVELLSGRTAPESLSA